MSMTAPWILASIFFALALVLAVMLVREKRPKTGASRTSHPDAERQLAERTAQLEAAAKELEAFSYSISHDLRAPLRAMQGYTQIIENEYGDKFDDEGRRLMGRVLENGRKISRMMDELLMFSRLGKKEMSRQDFSMKDVVTAIGDELMHAEEGRTFDFKVGNLPDFPSDLAAIKQVWQILLSNAVKFTRRKERAEIQIEGSESQGKVTYSIRDNGVGFDMRYSDRLFSVFQKLHADEDFEGLGMGLAVAQRIVIRHGGRIWVESAPDQGTIFYFTLNKPSL